MGVVITLTTDFGLADAHVAPMTGVVVGSNPRVALRYPALSCRRARGECPGREAGGRGGGGGHHHRALLEDAGERHLPRTRYLRPGGGPPFPGGAPGRFRKEDRHPGRTAAPPP